MKLPPCASALLGITALALAMPIAAAPDGGGDPVKGKAIYARCAICHDLNTGANRIGPSLKGVMGRKSGVAPGFAFSPAMKSKGIVWSAASLDAYLTAPARYVPGNKMAFAGMPGVQDRANLIAYIKQSAR